MPDITTIVLKLETSKANAKSQTKDLYLPEKVFYFVILHKRGKREQYQQHEESRAGVL